MLIESYNGNVSDIFGKRNASRLLPWNRMGHFERDRFFGFALPDLVSEVKQMVSKRLFAPELDPGFFHGDATSSFKEIRFGEANVQLTFHENDKKKIDRELCVRVEPDIDYYKGLGAHALLEVFYNKLTNSLTDPAQAYVLRWMAGKQAGLPGFNPPYRLAE